MNDSATSLAALALPAGAGREAALDHVMAHQAIKLTSSSDVVPLDAERKRLYAFLDRFPGIEIGTYNDRLRSFTRLVYEAAQAQDRAAAELKADRPSDWRLAASHCSTQILQGSIVIPSGAPHSSRGWIRPPAR